MSVAVEFIDYRQSLHLDELETHLQSFLSGRVRGLRLVFQDDGLILRGQTSTYYSKQLAQQAVMKITRIAIVSNEIEVV